MKYTYWEFSSPLVWSLILGDKVLTSSFYIAGLCVNRSLNIRQNTLQGECREIVSQDCSTFGWGREIFLPCLNTSVPEIIDLVFATTNKMSLAYTLLNCSPPPLPPPIPVWISTRVCIYTVCKGGGIGLCGEHMQDLYTVYLTRFRTYIIVLQPQKKT